ncbi:MAG: manganese efflux pump [Bacteroidales bacterium]|nr:manganese efflux pump [Bacteroidales bacterium]
MIELILVIIALSCGLFQLSMSASMQSEISGRGEMVKIAAYFTMFQVLFLLAGWLLGMALFSLFDHMAQMVSFAIFSVIGLKMIWESFKLHMEASYYDLRNFKILVGLSLAAGFNTLIAGVGINFIGVLLSKALIMISFMAIFSTLLGLGTGQRFGCRYRGRWVKFVGGLIFIGVGVKCLLENI